MKQVRVINNEGCGQCLLLYEKKGVGLIASPNKGEVIVAKMDEQDSNLWHSGEYFKHYKDAVSAFEERTR